MIMLVPGSLSGFPRVGARPLCDQVPDLTQKAVALEQPLRAAACLTRKCPERADDHVLHRIRAGAAVLGSVIMDLQVIITIGSCATALGLTIRGVLAFLDHRGDRQLARHMFDETKSTDGLRGYVELRKAQHAVVALDHRLEDIYVSDEPPSISDGQQADVVGQNRFGYARRAAWGWPGRTR